jgi:hypothetical protein
MKIKFKTFNPYKEYDHHGYRTVAWTAASALNKWLEENPNVEVLSWQTTSVGDHHELYITIQYKEKI